MKMLFMIIHLTNFPKQARFCSIKCHINNYRAIRGSSREKLYQELGLELLKSRRWYQQLCLFFKLKKNKHSSYFFDKIPKVLWTWTNRNHNNIPLFKDTLMQIWKPIYIYLCLHMKIIYRIFCIITTFTFWVIRTQDIWNVCLQTYRNNRIC